MPKMVDLVRACALPSHQMMSAAKGALRVSGAEMVEILVHLAEHNKIFAEQARMTLAAWDEAASRTIASDPTTPQEVLDYWLNSKNLRPALFPLLIENASVNASKLAELAGSLKGQWLDIMLESQRVQGSLQVLTEMAGNKNLSAPQSEKIKRIRAGETAFVPESAAAPLKASAEAVLPSSLQPPTEPEIAQPAAIGTTDQSDEEAETALVAFFAEHANEIAAEGEKPFQAIGGIFDELHTEPQQAMAASAAGVVSAPSQPGAPNLAPLHRKIVNPEDEKRGSTLQKIGRLDVKGRIQLAMKGTKEERAILVRDGTKIVALAVLDSPKISDGEVEKFASQKNVLEAVLRAIPMKRRFAKNYAVVRNLTFNPRTPLDVSLGLMKNLLVQDLRNLAGNKEVAETIRKLALRMFKQKSEAASNKKD